MFLLWLVFLVLLGYAVAVEGVVQEGALSILGLTCCFLELNRGPCDSFRIPLGGWVPVEGGLGSPKTKTPLKDFLVCGARH